MTRVKELTKPLRREPLSRNRRTGRAGARGAAPDKPSGAPVRRIVTTGIEVLRQGSAAAPCTLAGRRVAARARARPTKGATMKIILWIIGIIFLIGLLVVIGLGKAIF